MSDWWIVLCTVGKQEDADRIAGELVARRLAACVSVTPVVSTYRWKGSVEKDAELLLFVKTRADRFAALREAIVDLHPYQVPEIVALPVAAGHPPYLAWLDESVSVAEAP